LDAAKVPADCLTVGDVDSNTKIIPTVDYSSKVLYKSALVSELNGNPYLSKDQLTRVKNSVCFNNGKDYLSAATSSTSMLLGLGSDCGVMFVQSNNLLLSSTVASARDRSRASSHKPTGIPTNVQTGADVAAWWVGRVQKIRRCVGTKWGVCRNPVDLQNCQGMSGKKAASGANVEILLNWFSKVPGLHKFKYDVTDSQWIDVDAVISTVF
jgi:hypothetical protein